MDYERYKLTSPRRPPGMGAFFDYGLAVTRFYVPKKARKTNPQPQPPQPPQPEMNASGATVLAITATMWRLPFQIPTG